MNKQDVNDLLKQVIQDDTWPYELKNELWNDIDRKVGARMSKLKRSSHHLQNTLAWISTVAVLACVIFAGGQFLLHRHSKYYTAASNSVGNRTESNNVTTSHQVNQQSTSNTTPNQPSSSSPVREHSYSSANEATSAITKIEQGFGQFYPSGPAINLGSGISAEFAGGAGQYSYKWNEGRWTILTQFWGSNATGTQVAKEMVAYLHTHMLPAPQNKGVIIVSQPSSSTTPKVSHTTIAWQVGSKVYELQQTGDPINALATVVSSSHG